MEAWNQIKWASVKSETQDCTAASHKQRDPTLPGLILELQ